MLLTLDPKEQRSIIILMLHLKVGCIWIAVLEYVTAMNRNLMKFSLITAAQKYLLIENSCSLLFF